MKSTFFASSLSLAAAESLTANPIRKVVSLLQEMQKKTEDEGRNEEQLYKKFECYCKTSGEQAQKQIDQNADKTAELQSKIKEDSATAKAAEEAYTSAKKERAETKQKLSDGDAKRLKAKNAFESQKRDDEQNIAALSSAITTLEQKGGESLLQMKNTHDFARLRKIVLVSTSLSAFEKQSMNAFLMNSAEAGFSSGTGEIIGMLKQIKEEFVTANNQRIAEEEEDAKDYADVRSAQQGLIASLSSSIEKNQEKAGQFAVSAANAKTELAEVQNSYQDALEWMKNNKESCATKGKEFAERTRIRGEELSALHDAIDMLNNDDSLDLFKDTLPAAPKASFVQKKNKLRRHKNFVKSIKAMRANHDSRLALISSLVSNTEKLHSEADRPKFAMVIEMIDKLVVVLKKEQKEDETARANCIETRNEQESEKSEVEHRIKNIEASANDAAAQIDSLQDKLKGLHENVDATDKLVAQATAQRKAENEEYVKSSAANTETVGLLAKVINRLQKFYNPDLHKEEEASSAANSENVGLLLQRRARVGYSLLQTNSKVMAKVEVHQPAAPSTWDSGYKNKGGNPVVAMIQKFVTDLKTEMTEAKMDEENSQKEYEKLMADMADSKYSDNKQITQKDMQLAEQRSFAEQFSEEGDAKKNELMGVEQTLLNLNQECAFIEKNFDLRRRNRENEVESLANAKAALQGATAESFLQTEVSTKSNDPIAPFGKVDTAQALQNAAADTQNTLVDAVENAEVSEIKRTVFRALTRLRAATIKEFDTIARLETQAIDAYNDAHHFRGENPITHLHNAEAGVETDKFQSFHSL